MLRENPIDTDRHHTVSVTSNGNGVISGLPANGSVPEGDTVEIFAHPSNNHLFVLWKGDFESTDNPLRIAVTRDISLEAVFKPAPSDHMVLVPAQDSAFRMGSNGKYAIHSLERPVHDVAFTYGFYLQRHEVTRGQYHSIMGQVQGSESSGSQDSLPVDNVSWYDAVLFCNALSKIHGYDTVYTYTAVCGSQQSCPYVLENLSIHYDRFGYRLPTEAEWEYACRAGSRTDFFWGTHEDSADGFAWFFDNAGDSAHMVMTKKPNPFGLYDMVGNVAEWVNDWMGPYPDSLVENPTGPRGQAYAVYEQHGERPVRGGAYKLHVAYLRSSGRRYGPYETAPRIKLPGVGFRLALGSFIEKNTSGPPVGAGLVDSSLSIDVLQSDLIEFLGTSKVKVVFVQDFGAIRKRLMLLDVTGAHPKLSVIVDSIPMATPTISPDGKKVAYGSYAEGYNGESQISIQAITGAFEQLHTPIQGFIPRWWTGIGTTDTFLIYTDGASMNASDQWLNEKTLRRKTSGNGAMGQEEVLWAKGSYHGGLSRDGRFLATGYTETRLIDLQILDEWLFYFRSPYNGRDDNGQTCNVSISPSVVRTDEVLLLDFGYSGTSDLVGSSYGVHEYIFKCNSKFFTWEHVSDWYRRPEGYDSWNFVEYTNHPDYAVAVAQSKYADSSDGLFLIDLTRDNHYLKLASGKNIRYPGLWIDPFELPEQQDPYFDFARYDVPVQWTSQLLLAEKLRLFWKRRTDIDVALFGSSPMSYGIDPSAMAHFSGLNLASAADFLGTATHLAVNYALTHAPNLKAICLDLSPGFLDRDPDAEPLRLNGLYASKGYELDKKYDFYRSGIPDQVAGRIAAFDSTYWPQSDSNGFFNHRLGGSWGTPVIEGDDYQMLNEHVQRNLADLEALCDSAATKGVQILLVNFPQSPDYVSTDYAGRYGPKRGTMDELTQWLRGLEARNDNFHFYDANENGNHDYSDKEAHDANHLGFAGAQRLTARVDSVLQTICK